MGRRQFQDGSSECVPANRLFCKLGISSFRRLIERIGFVHILSSSEQKRKQFSPISPKGKRQLNTSIRRDKKLGRDKAGRRNIKESGTVENAANFIRPS